MSLQLEAQKSHQEEKHQQVARILDSHMRDARSDRRTVKRFEKTALINDGRRRKEIRAEATRHLQQHAKGEPVTTNFTTEHMQNLQDIRAAVKKEDTQEEKDSYDPLDRLRLLMQANSRRFSGLSREQKKAMFKAAGYTDDEINKSTGKNVFKAFLLAQGLTSLSLVGRGTGSFNSDLYSLADAIPHSNLRMAVVGALAVYTATNVALVDANFRLTEKTGTSANLGVTSTFVGTDHLFSKKVRNFLSRVIPTTHVTIMSSGVYPLVIGEATGDPRQVIAGTAVAAGLNLIYTAGCHAALWINRKRKKEEISQQHFSQTRLEN